MDKDKKEAIDTELEKVGITLSTETLNLLSSQVSEAIINSDISNKVLVSYKPFSSAMRKIIESPDFPKPFSIVGGGNNKWLKSQVEDWILKKYEESSSLRRATIFRTR